jgi:hypothetical protein
MIEPHSIARAISLARAMSLFWVDLSPPQRKTITTVWRPCEIHAIASSDIDTHLAHCAANGTGITQIAETGGLQAGKNAGLGTHVAQIGKPFAEDLGLLELVHEAIVSIWILTVKDASTEPVAA